MRSLYQKNWIFYLAITLITLFVWYKILNQTFLGEGYMYFNKNLSLLSNFRLSAFTDYDNFAKIFFDITIPIFKDNLVLYQLSALIMVIINVLFNDSQRLFH